MATRKEMLEKVKEYLEENGLASIALSEIEKFAGDHDLFAFGFFNPEQPALEIEMTNLGFDHDKDDEYFLGTRNYYCRQSKKYISLFDEEWGKEVILVWKV